MILTASEDIFLAFAIGFSSSVHCLGMCGPIIAACNVKLAKPGALSRLFFTLQYNAGRLLTYSLLGALAGLVGGGFVHSISLVFLQKGVAILAGIIIILIGFSLLNLIPGRHVLEGGPLWETVWFQKASAALFANPVNGFPAGLFMGLLPCGMVYALLAKAASTADALQGGFLMLSFGTGTLPAMITAGLASRFLDKARGSMLLKISCLLIILMGFFTIWRASMS